MSVCVDFGGVWVEASSDDPGWLEAVQTRYREFIGDGPCRLQVTYTRSREQAPWAAILSPTRARLLGDPVAERLGAVVRQLLPNLVEDGLVCHAALLEDGRRGLLCCGASGAGKSTLARLLPHRAVADELCMVCRQGETWRALSLPFGRARHVDLCLTQIFVLRHGAATTRTRIRGSQAIALLEGHVSWPVDDPKALECSFGVLSELAATIPIWDLAFAPTPVVWQTLVGDE